MLWAGVTKKPDRLGGRDGPLLGRRPGDPVAVYTVAKGLGHRSTEMVERVYGYLEEVRHRKEVVEYRVENHREELGERVVAVQALQP